MPVLSRFYGIIIRMYFQQAIAAYDALPRDTGLRQAA